jgi:protein required for attachment to host cells
MEDSLKEEQLIAVVDGARARFFAVGTRTKPSGEEKNKLDEVETLINPAHRTKDGDLFSETRPGLRKAFAGGPGHGVDDKRDAHTDEFDRKFAKLVLERMASLIRDRGVVSAILAAGPKMLGHLREHRGVLPRVDIGELPKHLTELSPHDLCLRLESDGLI